MVHSIKGLDWNGQRKYLAILSLMELGIRQKWLNQGILGAYILLYRDGNEYCMSKLIKNNYIRAILHRENNHWYLIGAEKQDVQLECLIGLWAAVMTYDPLHEISFPNYARMIISRSLATKVKKSNNGKASIMNAAVSCESLYKEGDSGMDWESYLGSCQMEPRLPSDEEIVETLTQMVAPQNLTSLEIEVALLKSKGYKYSEIAESLDKPWKSVDNAISRLKKKFLRSASEGAIIIPKYLMDNIVKKPDGTHKRRKIKSRRLKTIKLTDVEKSVIMKSTKGMQLLEIANEMEMDYYDIRKIYYRTKAKLTSQEKMQQVGPV